MANRRLQKMARVIRDSVSRTVSQRLSDPRITGLISVTEVEISPDIKNATVYLSIMAANDEAKTRAFHGICSAAGVIQYHLGRELVSRFCPHLRFELDTKMQQTIRTLEMIERAAEEYKDHDRNDNDEDDRNDGNAPSQEP
jgi:ribosome-binding factor A